MAATKRFEVLLFSFGWSFHLVFLVERWRLGAATLVVWFGLSSFAATDDIESKEVNHAGGATDQTKLLYMECH